MDLREIGWEGGVEWIHLAKDRDRWRAVVNAVMKLWVLAPRSYLVYAFLISAIRAIGPAHLIILGLNVFNITVGNINNSWWKSHNTFAIIVVKKIAKNGGKDSEDKFFFQSLWKNARNKYCCFR
jgi:hypothetical protein